MPATDELPIYLKVRNDVRTRISSGAYPAGTAIPSENDLAELYGTTRLTVRNAIDALVDEGLIRRVQGKGAFSAGSLAIQRGEIPQGFREQTEHDLHVPGVRILETRLRAAGPRYASLFSMGEDDDLYMVRRLNSVDGEPYSVETTYIPRALFPGITEVDISVFSLYETYAFLGHKVTRVHELIDLAELSANEAHLLHVKACGPAMVLDCMSYDANGTPVEHAVSLTRGDLGSYSVRY